MKDDRLRRNALRASSYGSRSSSTNEDNHGMTTTTSTTKNPHGPFATAPSSSSSSSVLWNRLVLSILITETAERVAYFGFRAVLVLYFTHGLQFSEPTAVSLCAATVALSYFSPLLGAVLADASWGRFQTIWRFGLMYAMGLCCLTWAAYGVPNYSNNSNNANEMEDEDEPMVAFEVPVNMVLARFLTFFGLFFVCIGTGGIKPCVSAFGADQVVMDDEEEDDAENEDALPVPAEKIAQSTKKLKEEKDVFQDEDEGGLEMRPEGVASSKSIKSKQRQARIREFFNSFYFSINVGALCSFALIPLVRANFGFGASFLIPTISMILALGIFRFHKNEYKHRKQRDASKYSLLQVLQVSCRILLERFLNTKLGRSLGAMLGRSRIRGHAIIPRDEADSDDDEDLASTDSSNSDDDKVYHDASQALHILPLMAFFPIFWMLYDQQGSVWTLQATRMNLHGLEPEQLQFLNPLEIMIFIPLFDVKVYPWLEQHGFNIQPLRRMEYGMFLTAVSFAISTLLEQRIHSQATMSVSVIWQIPQITILTVAEILLNVTGLEFAYSQAPANMQAMILALYLFMTAIGDGLAALLYGSVFAYLSSAVAMLICAICMLINMALFAMVARKWTPYNHEPETTEGLELGPVHNMEHQH